MARHLMAVCVVCILCAEQFPCKEHFDNLTKPSKQQLDKLSSSVTILTAASTITATPTTNNRNSYINYESLLNFNPSKQESLKDHYDRGNDQTGDDNNDYKYRIDLQNYNNKRKGRTKKQITENLTKFIGLQQQRNEPDDHYHDHHQHRMVTATATTTTQKFLKKLFEQFGNSDGQTMDLNGFETMLKRLGLYNLIKDNIPNDNDNNRNNNNNRYNYNNNNNNNNEESTSDESCISSLELISRLSSSKSKQQHHHHDHHDKMQSTELDQNNNGNAKVNITTGSNEGSSNSNGIISEDHEHNHNDHDPSYQQRKNVHLNFDNIFSICPILLYQLTAPTSLERSGCINSSLIPLQNNNMLLSSSPLVAASTDYDDDFQEDRFYVWVYAIVSVLGVSLVGLLGVAVIPCMDRHIYQHIIQFLVALAVGTLAGDALLHLLPHSMMMFSSHESGHESMVWKGLVAVLGIIFFFAMERGLTMIAEWRKKIEKKEKPSSRVRVMRDPDSTSINNSIAGDKLCKHKYSSYPYCYDEIAMDTKDDHHHHHQDIANQKNNSTTATIEGGGKMEKTSTTPITCNKNSIHAYRNSNNDHGDNNETAQSLLPPHNYTTISDSFSVMNKDDSNNPDNNTISTNLDENSIEGGVRDKPLMREETFTIILREHESSHHGHSHKHGHVHSPPRTLSAVAWMVVMGDGLHNFTDGMAIGAAFSNNIAGGFSTAIAVFCHELPHELGDFAVLLKAGMSAKQAVYYNLLSSVLSFFGMILGVLIGDTPEASAWIFACAAGMFIYIALVDMMPELTSTHNERCALSQCLLQLLGMSSGLGIMLLIALYEHDLKHMFSTSSGDHHHNHFH